MGKIVLCLIVCWCNTWAQDLSANSVISSNSELAVATGSVQFSLELLQAASGIAGKFMNLAISPFSVWTVLALLKEGSVGKTHDQLQRALRLPESSKDIRAAFRQLHNALHNEDNSVEFDMASALFTDMTRPLQWQFEYLAHKVYQTDILPVNFADPPGTVSYINRWVSNVTHNRINQLVHEDDMIDPHLVIASGLFFKGKWETPFNASTTVAEKFYDDKGEELGEVMMMHVKEHFRYSFIEDLGARVVELPYQGGHYSMFVMLPTGDSTLDIVLTKLSKLSMEEIYERMIKEDAEYPDAPVQVFLPRVVILSDYVLNKALENMGILDLFNDAKADLSGMSAYNIYLHKMIHKTEIVINEEGTIASSATGGIAIDRDMNPVFYANRPFAFFIIERSTRLLMFAGKVVNPHM